MTRSRTCKRCGRSMISLEMICTKLAAAPIAARMQAEVDRRDQNGRNAYALGHLTGAVEDLVLNLSCHTGACAYSARTRGGGRD